MHRSGAQNHRRIESFSESGNSTANAQESNLFRKFNELALSGTPDEFWPEIALKTQQVLDACLAAARNEVETAV